VTYDDTNEEVTVVYSEQENGLEEVVVTIDEVSTSTGASDFGIYSATLLGVIE
jgi:hypothetical protein